MEGHHQLHHHQHRMSNVVADTGVGDRFPQWSIQETKDFLMIRSELDRNFMETKRNKLLWNVIASKMNEKGYRRSAEQCKCKWKNLVTRYKGCETMEAEAVRQQFPFFNEMQVIFAARMERMLWAEVEGGENGSKKKPMNLSSEEEDENVESDQGEKRVTKKRRKGNKNSTNVIGSTSGSGCGSGSNNVREILEDFMKQQMQMEMQWREAFEAREKERIMKEMEWRHAMEALENERIMMDRRWREREEQRMMREEARAEKRDALITALLNKLRREDHL